MKAPKPAAGDPPQAARERDAWEWGVVACAGIMMRRAGNESERNGIMAEVMGLLHGTMGPGEEYRRRRTAREAMSDVG